MRLDLAVIVKVGLLSRRVRSPLLTLKPMRKRPIGETDRARSVNDPAVVGRDTIYLRVLNIRLSQPVNPLYPLFTRSTQHCIHTGLLNRVPYSFGWGKGGNVTFAGWQLTLCDHMWHASSGSGVATLRTAIHLLLTYLLNQKRRGGATIGRRTCDQEVAGLTPGLALLRKDRGQVVHTHVLLSPSSIIW